jgi:DNA ligase 1
VFEVAFDSIHESGRHKSGLAMRFPRIARIRTDKPASEADRIDTLRRLIT